MRHAVALALALVALPAAAQDGFSDGQSFAQQSVTTSGSSATFSNTTANANVPGFSGAAPVQSSFLGQAGLGPVSNTKITGCANSPPNPNAVAQQECDAINFLEKNTTQRVRVDLSKDPLFQQAHAAAAGADLSGAPGTGTTQSQTCTPRTVTTPAAYDTEICNEGETGSQPQCAVGTQYSVTAKQNYQCDTTYEAYETLTCNRGASVTLSMGQCTPGSIVGQTGISNAAGNGQNLYFTVYCSANSTFTVNYEWSTVSSYGDNWWDFYAQNGFAMDVPNHWVYFGQYTTSVGLGMNVSNMAIGSGGVGCNFTVYLSQSCSSTTCTISTYELSDCMEGNEYPGAITAAIPINATVSIVPSEACLALQARTQ